MTETRPGTPTPAPAPAAEADPPLTPGDDPPQTPEDLDSSMAGLESRMSAGDDPPQTPEDLDYYLPAGAIAQTPLDERDRARLLVDRGDRVDHLRVADLDSLLKPGDVVVVNDTRVFPARLRLRRATGGAVEVLLLPASADDEPPGSSPRPVQGGGSAGVHSTGGGSAADGWREALVRPSRRLRVGEVVASGGLELEIGADLGRGRRLVRPVAPSADDQDLDRDLDRLEGAGEVALPPYIREPIADPERYQTVFARRPGSVAAPTAGLHLTEALLEKIRARGATVAALELAIGLDTFRPVTADRLDDHVMHREHYRVPAAAAEAVAAAQRVVAVGTTVVRALETWVATGEASGRSSLFIRRPFDWRAVDVLMTNFHLPRSTLLCLVDAFVGPRWRRLYETALVEGYRFLSFGDAMFLSRTRKGG